MHGALALNAESFRFTPPNRKHLMHNERQRLLQQAVKRAKSPRKLLALLMNGRSYEIAPFTGKQRESEATEPQVIS